MQLQQRIVQNMAKHCDNVQEDTLIKEILRDDILEPIILTIPTIVLLTQTIMTMTYFNITRINNFFLLLLIIMSF
jgi:hypothetical protein